METTLPNPLILSSSLLITLLTILTSPIESTSGPCDPDSCDPIRGPQIRFPFRLAHRQPAHCGYPGFDLSCDPTTNKTLLTLPGSGKFVVDDVDYRAQEVLVSDPGSCLPNRSLHFTVRGSPFAGTYMTGYALLNCSSANWSVDSVPLPCLSGRNYTVVAVRGGGGVVAGGGCRWVRNVSVPLVWSSGSDGFGPAKNDFALAWSDPDCTACEGEGDVCGMIGDDAFGSSYVGCYTKFRNGLSKSTKYAIVIAGVISGTLCILGLACCAFGKIWISNLRHRLNPDISSTTGGAAAATTTARTGGTGLDLPTIQSYPKTVVGQSRRLPNPGEKTCAICLSEYEPEETLKSIPDCNHFFHEGCIDKWLKLNGTCPLCRSPLESSSSRATSSSCHDSSALLSSDSSSPTTAIDRR